jgi:hypothetical protein
MGVGVSVATASMRYLIERSLEESSWDAYRTMKADAGSLGRLPPRAPVLSFTPLPRGGLVTTTVPF